MKFLDQLDDILEARRRKKRRPELPAKEFKPPQEVPKYEVKISNKALRDLKKLSSKDKRTVIAAIKAFEKLLPTRHSKWGSFRGEMTNIMRADGKLSIGKYRALTIINDKEKIATIVGVNKRGSSKYGFKESLDDMLEYIFEDEDIVFTIDEAIELLNNEEPPEDEPPIDFWKLLRDQPAWAEQNTTEFIQVMDDIRILADKVRDRIGEKLPQQWKVDDNINASSHGVFFYINTNPRRSSTDSYMSLFLTPVEGGIVVSAQNKRVADTPVGWVKRTDGDFITDKFDIEDDMTIDYVTDMLARLAHTRFRNESR